MQAQIEPRHRAARSGTFGRRRRERPRQRTWKKKTGSVSTPAAGTTTSGLPVTGTFNITSFKNVDGAITAIGTFTGSVDGGAPVTTQATSVVQAANGKPLAAGTAAPAAAAAAAGTCSILDLTLRPLHLDLLGLVVDRNQEHLQIAAEQGSGNFSGTFSVRSPVCWTTPEPADSRVCFSRSRTCSTRSSGSSNRGDR